jgi:putative transposase
MKKPKCLDLDYINFLIAAQKTFTEASRSSPDITNKPAHDAFTRLLQRQSLSSDNLWNELKTFLKNVQGVLIIDDTLLEKPYFQKNGLITHFWSNKDKK